MTLDADAFRLVRCNKQGHILRHESCPLPEAWDRSSNLCAPFLKNCLSRFCSHWRTWPLWLCASTSGQQLRFLQLQRIRSRDFSKMVYWTFRKDIPFDTDKTIFDFGRHGESNDPSVDVTVCTALKDEVEALTAPFTMAGISLSGVVAPSFALEAVCQHYKERCQEGATLLLHTGEDLASILVWESGSVSGNRIFKTGVTSEQVRAFLQQKPSPETETLESMLDRLAQQVDRTMSAHLTAHPEQRFSRLLLTGPLAQIPDLQRRLQQLGIETFSSMESPTKETIEGAWLPALGAALSNAQSTPNFLYPIQAREALQRRAQMHLFTALLLGVGALAVMMSKGILTHGNSTFQQRLFAEQARLSVYDPEVNETVLRPSVVQIVEEKQRLRQLAHRWHAPAVLQALASLTPSTVRMTQLELQMEPTARRGAVLRAKGISSGVPTQQLAVLAAFVLELEKHPLFQLTTLRQVAEMEERGQRTLQFEIEVELTPLETEKKTVQEGRSS